MTLVFLIFLTSCNRFDYCAKHNLNKEIFLANSSLTSFSNETTIKLLDDYENYKTLFDSINFYDECKIINNRIFEENDFKENNIFFLYTIHSSFGYPFYFVNYSIKD